MWAGRLLPWWPMAIMHQTDGEQRISETTLTHDPAHLTHFTWLAPHGGHSHALAHKVYFLLFAVNVRGVPSAGKIIFRH
jgi:hypothetical protein